MTECTDSKWLFSFTRGPTVPVLAFFEIFLSFQLPSFFLLRITDQFLGTKCPARIRVLTFGHLDQLIFHIKTHSVLLHLYTHTHARFYCFTCTAIIDTCHLVAAYPPEHGIQYFLEKNNLFRA